jgi:predicted kinase
MVFGLPGSGKSYFAKRVAQMLSARHISSDGIRKEISTAPDYSFEAKAKVYDELLRRTVEAAEHGKEVVADATFYTNDLRQKFINEAQKATGVFLIEVFAEEDIIKSRLAQKREDSDADFSIYKAVKKAWEPFGTDKHLVLKSTNDNVTEMLEQTADYLFSKNDKTKH